MRLHGHAQEQIADDADEFSIDFLTIFLRDSCSRHDGKKASTRKRRNNNLE
jgi:hypothetical protein